MSDAPPIIFLAGPPGSGKTTLGQLACELLGVTFLDLASPGPGAEPLAEREAQLKQAIKAREADVITIPWELQDAAHLKQARSAGTVVLLWAHPLDMMARSGRPDLTFTPARKLKTGGGFGSGTNCNEFRRLDRACGEVVFVVNCVETAADDLATLIEEIHGEAKLPPAEREGLTTWAKEWQEDKAADPEATEVLVDAMARYTLHLKAKGTSPRTLSGVYDDLNAAGFLLFSYDEPTGDEVLGGFGWGAPHEYDFKRKFSDSPAALRRYARNLKGFGKFLVQEGLVEGEEGDEE